MTQTPPRRTLRDYALITLKGLAMGAADVVPGVSGGTIAFISGIYDELLDSLKKCTPAALLMIPRQGLKPFWQHINGAFLIALFLGILTSIKTFAALITVALKEHPVLIWAFFLGLILSSVVLLVKHIPRWRVKDLLGLVAGALFVAGVSFMTPAQLPGHWWIMFLGGYIGICAMLLPGISGSFILLLVGLYPVFLRAVNELDLLLLVSFGSGAIAGLITFSRFLSWLLQQYHQITIATLIGFLIGSLTVTWPWKQALVTTVDHHGETIVLQSANVLPSTYTAVTGQPHLLFPALACALAGVALVLGLEWIAAKYGKQH